MYLRTLNELQTSCWNKKHLTFCHRLLLIDKKFNFYLLKMTALSVCVCLEQNTGNKINNKNFTKGKLCQEGILEKVS